MSQKNANSESEQNSRAECPSYLMGAPVAGGMYVGDVMDEDGWNAEGKGETGERDVFSPLWEKIPVALLAAAVISAGLLAVGAVGSDSGKSGNAVQEENPKTKGGRPVGNSPSAGAYASNGAENGVQEPTSGRDEGRSTEGIEILNRNEVQVL